MRKIHDLLLAALLLVSFRAPAQALQLSEIRSEARTLALDNGIRLRFSTSTVNSFINEAQRLMNSDAEMIVKNGIFELQIGTTYYGLPTDYVHMKRLSINYLIRDEISPESLDTKAGLSWEMSKALPTNYFINFSSRTKLGFYPWPSTSSSTGTVRYEYYAQVTELSADSDIPFNGITEFYPYHHTLAYWAASRMAAVDGRGDLAATYQQIFLDGMARAMREANRRPSYRPGLSPTSATNRAGP